jgi:hypothetical protein
MWFQYVVGYDRQEQRSLATSLHNYVFDYVRLLSQAMTSIKNASPAIVRTAGLFILILLGLAMLVVIVRRVKLLGWRKALRMSAQETGAEFSTIVFYERLTNLLAQRGMLRDAHLTPLEFASRLESRVALQITLAYNRVRFGGEQLSTAELREIEHALTELEGATAK